MTESNHGVLHGKEIVLGVTGGIACYKAIEILRGFKREGAHVSVVMTHSATQFVQPLTFQTLSNRPVGIELFDLDQESRMGHIHLADRADLMLVAPCTANFLAKYRIGQADDLLSTMVLATPAPVYLAPAMNDNMWKHPATVDNVAVLSQRGVRIIPPDTGFLAEGREGPGRLADPVMIVDAIRAHFEGGETYPAAPPPLTRILAGRRVLITAGPTVEKIDPVRYITNRSSGRMGYAIAEACRDAGAEVQLVSGPVNLAPPRGVALTRVTSAEEMRTAVLENQPRQDAMIFAAAVSDYRVEAPAEHKIKRGDKPNLDLALMANPDIAAEAGSQKRPGQVIVVFAAESQHLLDNARKKLAGKHADMVVANDISEPGSGFESQKNRVTLLRAGGNGDAEDPRLIRRLPLMEKTAVAVHIVHALGELLEGGAA